MLILIENKDSIKYHTSEKENNPQKYAVDGIKHYLKFFTSNFLKKENKTIQDYFKNWKFLGLAVSGNVEDEYSYKVSSLIIKNENNKSKIENLNNNNFLNEEEYLALFENVKIEEIINQISKSYNEINQILRNMDSQKRPILLRSLMICLFDRKDIQNDFKTYFMGSATDTIINNVPLTLEKIFKKKKSHKTK